MVYGHLANLSFTGSLSMTSKMTKMLGYLQPEYFPYWFCDHWTDDIVKIIGRTTFANFRTDQSNAGHTQEMRETGWWATFFDACYLKRRREARSIIDNPDFAGEQWQKELVYSNHPLIEQRSRTLNLFVKQQEKKLGLGAPKPDERYQRIKKKAIDMLPELLADPEMSRGEIVAFTHILTPPTIITALKQAFA
jgi:hypothetical protein